MLDFRLKSKRGFDFLLSGLSIFLLFPVFIIIAVLIKTTSKGSVFFRMTRIGKDKKPFIMIKFRSMVENASSNGMFVTAKGDVRITKIGNFLRRTKLDELPELWNILKGDMSFVGPRPEVEKYVKNYKETWLGVFRLRPGLTDLATLQFRDEESIMKLADDIDSAYLQVVLPLKLKLSLEYTESISLWLDLKIIILTVWGITLGRIIGRPDDRYAVKAIEQILDLNRKQAI